MVALVRNMTMLLALSMAYAVMSESFSSSVEEAVEQVVDQLSVQLLQSKLSVQDLEVEAEQASSEKHVKNMAEGMVKPAKSLQKEAAAESLAQVTKATAKHGAGTKNFYSAFMKDVVHAAAKPESFKRREARLSARSRRKV
mmetsp:Transcript_105581/g.187766  ORF Transcript_105581/g.187766 Transcript_105581/m.187766 type:complete len:141 (+) Transcript_105581:117-539(+)